MNKDKIFIFLIILLIVGGFTLLNGRSATLFFTKEFNRVNFLTDLIQKREPLLVKAVYVTFRTAGNDRINEIINLIKRTELNAIVIDLKDYTGRIPFETNNEIIKNAGSEKIFIADIKGLVKRLHKGNIYTIARIAVFEDDYLSRERTDLALKRVDGGIWEDNNGLAWVDPASQEVWDYNLEVAKEAIKVGFDEINFDYIRFPSDGNMTNIVYPFWDGKTLKKEVIRHFFEYVNQRMKPLGIPISADLFGLTLTSTNDLGIGQWLEYAVPNFDYICPMVYPSHYQPTFLGFQNPAEHPYEVIYDGLKKGNERITSLSATFPGKPMAKLRPWLQDFNMGAIYDARMIELQKKATYDAGGFGWLLWNPRNIYTENALHKEE
ncbi:MAG: putative glycoside hydrolase [bacterium]|nr:putative glycoside hydrolase [bacterium]